MILKRLKFKTPDTIEEELSIQKQINTMISNGFELKSIMPQTFEGDTEYNIATFQKVEC
ncbi:hypothetical protein V1503_24505 [Bacillus sp. SCS-151]|uniref:hypothetical protein n=1 Tax=Nanhaiella sioensis TaxID=3115293 RepID=UPI003978C716